MVVSLHLSLIFSSFSNVCHCMCVWPTALKLDCITIFGMLFLVMRFTSLVDKIQFMLIISRHICIYKFYCFSAIMLKLIWGTLLIQFYSNGLTEFTVGVSQHEVLQQQIDEASAMKNSAKARISRQTPRPIPFLAESQSRP